MDGSRTVTPYMGMPGRWLAATAVAAAMLPSVVGAQADGAFTVIAKITPATVANGATATLQVQTRIGSDCTARVTYHDGASVDLAPSHERVGQSGVISWHWVVKTTTSSAQAFVSCQWRGQGRGAFANVTIQGRHDLPAAARPVPSRPGVAVLGATKVAWAQIFGPYLRSTLDNTEGWQACFDAGLTPRLSAVFREGHAFAVSGAFCTDNPPDATQRVKEATQFFPVGTTYVGKYTKSDGSGADLEYFAPSLARVFVPGDFLDCDGNLAKPGTFSLSLDIQGAEEWNVQLGTCT